MTKLLTVNPMTLNNRGTNTTAAIVSRRNPTTTTSSTITTSSNERRRRISGKSLGLNILLVLSLLTTATAQGAGASFNFEISKRTEAAVRNFMQPPVMVNEMSNNGYAVGSVAIADVPSVRKWEFTQLLSFKTLYMVYAGFETGFFTGYIRGFNDAGEHVYKYTERTGTDNTLPGAVRKYWWSKATNGDLNPNGLGVIRNRTYDHRARGWYEETKAAGETIWSSIYGFSSTNELGLTHCQPVYDSNKKFSGVLAVDYTLGNIDSFLTEAFSKGDRSVFLVEHDTGLLVASSTLDPLLRVTEEGGKPGRVPAINR